MMRQDLGECPPLAELIRQTAATTSPVAALEALIERMGKLL